MSTSGGTKLHCSCKWACLIRRTSRWPASNRPKSFCASQQGRKDTDLCMQLLLIPLFAAIFAYMFLGEKLSSVIVPGGPIVLTGVVMILRQKGVSREPPIENDFSM